MGLESIKKKIEIDAQHTHWGQPWEKRRKRPRMQKAGGMRRDISDKTLMCKRTESYWGKKNGTRERTRVLGAAGGSSGKFK